jgi:hypothetical protein
MQINISNPKLDSTYNLAGNPRLTTANYNYYVPTSPNNESSFTDVNEESWNGSGSLTITKFDTVGRRISASFNFIGVADSAHVVHVTNGAIINVQWYDSNK